ncbi:guanylate kinase [Gammaproteobacteria bacterium]|nr:guanylate kinase [Gammaproteobacteria bacterium]
MLNERGTLLILSAPSGAGKTSLTHALLERRDDTELCVSHTTRLPRHNEVPGVHYHFVEREAFERKIAAGEFLEYARVFDHYYGTGRDQVEAWRDLGRHVLLDIDWQGAQQVKAQLPEAVTVLICPPSMPVLERRLRARGTEDDAAIERRLSSALDEIAHAKDFDRVLINDDFESTVARLQALLEGREVVSESVPSTMRPSSFDR